jgi:hypothetical protein
LLLGVSRYTASREFEDPRNAKGPSEGDSRRASGVERATGIEPATFSLGIGHNTLAFPWEEGGVGPMLGVTGSAGGAQEALVTLARGVLAAVDEGRPPGDLVRALALATLATIPPGASLWLRAAELLEAHPQRLRRAVLLAGEVIEAVCGSPEGAPDATRGDGG